MYYSNKRIYNLIINLKSQLLLVTISALNGLLGLLKYFSGSAIQV